METINFNDYVLSFSALLATILLLTEFVKNTIKLKGLALQVVSWLVGVVVSLGAYLFGLGMFEGMLLWQSLVVGVGASLVANGVADTGIITAILKLLKLIK